jgi:hypothetical protein
VRKKDAEMCGNNVDSTEFLEALEWLTLKAEDAFASMERGFTMLMLDHSGLRREVVTIFCSHCLVIVVHDSMGTVLVTVALIMGGESIAWTTSDLLGLKFSSHMVKKPEHQ